MVHKFRSHGTSKMDEVTNFQLAIKNFSVFLLEISTVIK